jgi:hypothetical protein
MVTTDLICIFLKKHVPKQTQVTNTRFLDNRPNVNWFQASLLMVTTRLKGFQAPSLIVMVTNKLKEFQSPLSVMVIAARSLVAQLE